MGVGGGGIFCDITLTVAYAELDKATVNLKYVLFFVDGADAESLGSIGLHARRAGPLPRRRPGSLLPILSPCLGLGGSQDAAPYGPGLGGSPR